MCFSWNWKNETYGLRLFALGPRFTATSFKTSLSALIVLRKEEKKKKTGWQRKTATMWKAGQLCLLFFPLPIKASLAQGYSTSSSIFIFFTQTLLFTKGASMCDRRKAFLLPQTLQTQLDDNFILYKISISAVC